LRLYLVSDDDPSSQLLGSSITYRIAIGPQQGRKVFTLQTLPNLETSNPLSGSVGEAGGFSLHAGVATKGNERAKFEQFARNFNCTTGMSVLFGTLSFK